MQAFDMFLNGNLVALPIVQKTFGVIDAEGNYAILIQVAERTLPIRTVRRLHWCTSRRFCHEPAPLPLDNDTGIGTESS